MSFSEGFMPVVGTAHNNRGKYGYIDKTGKIIIPPRYMYAELFSEGLAAVKLPHSIPGMSGIWGYIQKNGEFVIAPMYDNVTPFHDGRAFGYKKGEGWVLIDKTGKQISGQLFEAVRNGFSEGLAAVRVNHGWGFIDTEGRWKIPPPRFGPAYSFNEGLAGVGLDTGGWGFINKEGNVVFDRVTDLLPLEYTLQFYKGWALIPYITGSTTKYGYLCRDGRKLPAIYRAASDFYEGVAVVWVDSGVGIIDEEGGWVIPPGEFESLSPISDGMVIAIKNGKISCINTKGALLF
jgi:hypothetical protein